VQGLRILHILPKLKVSGAENMAAYLILHLSRSHEVSAINLHPPSDSVIEQSLRRSGIPVWYLGKRAGFDPRMFPAISKVLREVRPEIVHSHLSVLRYTLPGMLLHRIPVSIHTVHNAAEYEVDQVGRAIHKIAFRCNVFPVAISQEGARSFKGVYGRDPKAVIPNGIPVDNYLTCRDTRRLWRMQEGFEQDWVLFTCVGRLNRQKNPMMLLKAFAAISNPKSHLVLIGDGTLLPQLRREARVVGIEERVHFLGERNDVRECLAAADVFVLASDWEGNPLSVMEAMASGLPVIATAVGGVPELIGNDGILVDPGDCSRFAENMKELLQDHERRLVLGNAARKRALDRFRVEQMVQAYELLYRTELAFYRKRRSGPSNELADIAGKAS
jgi:glycosyltransferase involved in cell wall biosynthesis